MMPLHKWLIARRIACPEAGYPESEARYMTITDYVESIEQELLDYLADRGMPTKEIEQEKRNMPTMSELT